MKDREWKESEVKLKRELEELFLKPIIVSIDDIDQFEEKEMKKTRPMKTLGVIGWIIIFQ